MYNSCSGFTLFELTISIAMIGIIVLIIISAMRLGSRSVESGEKRIESLERMRSSLNIIDSQVQSYAPLTYEEEGVRKYYFKGEKEFMQFSTNSSIWSGEKGYIIATYSVKSGDHGKQVLYVSENIVGMGGEREAKLFDTFERIYFEYFFKDPTEQEGKWIEKWPDEITIPKKIKVHLIEGTRDLSLIIPLRANKSFSDSATGAGSFEEEFEEE